PSGKKRGASWKKTKTDTFSTTWCARTTCPSPSTPGLAPHHHLLDKHHGTNADRRKATPARNDAPNINTSSRPLQRERRALKAKPSLPRTTTFIFHLLLHARNFPIESHPKDYCIIHTTSWVAAALLGGPPKSNHDFPLIFTKVTSNIFIETKQNGGKWKKTRRQKRQTNANKLLTACNRQAGEHQELPFFSHRYRKLHEGECYHLKLRPRNAYIIHVQHMNGPLLRTNVPRQEYDVSHSPLSDPQRPSASPRGSLRQENTRAHTSRQQPQLFSLHSRRPEGIGLRACSTSRTPTSSRIPPR
ncbi:unnamed protein product, partial [Ectocarpus sp. 8 AP-2014]